MPGKMKTKNEYFTAFLVRNFAVWFSALVSRPARLFLWLLFILGLLISARATAPYGAQLDRRFAEPAGSTNESKAAYATLSDPKRAALERALKAEQEKQSRGTRESEPENPVNRTILLSLAAASLTFFLALLIFAKRLHDLRTANPEQERQAAQEALRKKLIAEEPTLVAFFNDLRHGLEISAEEPGGKADNTQTISLDDICELAPSRIAAFRAQLAKITRIQETVARKELLREFFWQVDAFRRFFAVPELRPAWLMLSGLAGLLKQLSESKTEFDTSILRTTASALNLLEELCSPGVDSQLANRTPVQLLGVDDDAVCLAALSRALTKAFDAPDTAREGETALALAKEKKYDAIFLDIEMPGMDGFELCSKILQTPLNQTTPIIFVTSHGDFESRAKSTRAGALSLIAKPYLSFEITVKALTLTLRGRIQANKASQNPTVPEKVECESTVPA